MEELIIPFTVTAIAFLFVSLAYSSVGLGGGSTYTALLTLSGTSYLMVPTISLTLNCVVTFIASINFIRHKHFRFLLLLPFLIGSIPMSYLGGSLVLSATTFYYILMVSLICVLARIYFWRETSPYPSLDGNTKLIASILIGGILGFVAGAVGIGGGIYLVPIILLLNLGSMKEASACGTVFIWINSMIGLSARVKSGLAIDYDSIGILLASVVMGAFLGSKIGAGKLDPKQMEKILGLIIALAVVFLARKIYLT